MDAELVEAVILLIFSSRFDRINDQKALFSQPLFKLPPLGVGFFEKSLLKYK